MSSEFECLYNEDYLSARLDLTCDSAPPFDVIDEYYSERHAETPKEFQKFSLNSLYFQDENNIKDLVAVNYIAKFLQHYCPHNEHYESLNLEGKKTVSNYFSILAPKLAFIQKAIQVSNCSYQG